MVNALEICLALDLITISKKYGSDGEGESSMSLASGGCDEASGGRSPHVGAPSSCECVELRRCPAEQCAVPGA